MARHFNDIMATFKTQLAADRKKAVVLAVLFVILLITVGWTLASGDSDHAAAPVPPAVVRPAPNLPAAAHLTRVTPQPGLSAPSARTAAADSPRTGPRPTAARPEQVVSVAGMPRSPVRDLFVSPAWHAFPSAGTTPEHQPKAHRSGLLERIREELRAYREWRRRTVQEIEADLSELKLQSTLTGAMPSAQISGLLVHEGDSIRGFSVVRIEDRRVKLRRAGITRSLRLP